MIFDFKLALSSIPFLLKGAFISLKIAFLSFIIGIFLGNLIAVLSIRKIKFIDFIINAYVSIIRGTPMLIQITFMYYFIPYLLGEDISPVLISGIAIGLNSAAYVSQIFKSAFLNFDKGQAEAALVLGLTEKDLAFKIFWPQVLKVIFPSIINEFTTLIKDSSLASIIGVMELYKEAKQIISSSYDVFTIFFILTMFYFLMTFAITFILERVERRFFGGNFKC